MRFSKEGITTLSVVILVAVLIVAITGVAIMLFLPIKPVDMNQHREIASEAGVQNLDLDISGEVGSVDLVFDDLDDKFLTLDVHVTGGIGILEDPQEYNLTFDYVISGADLQVEVDLDKENTFQGISFLNVDCQVVIHDDLRSDLKVTMGVGSVWVETLQYSNITGIDLRTSTGSVDAYFVPGTTMFGNVSLSTSVGSVYLGWEDVRSMQDTSMFLTSTTGSVNADIWQTITTGHDLSISEVTTTGGVSADIIVEGNVSSTIDWAFQTGRVDIHRQIGFILIGSHLESENHPGSDNVMVALSTTTGQVDIWAEWTT